MLDYSNHKTKTLLRWYSDFDTRITGYMSDIAQIVTNNQAMDVVMISHAMDSCLQLLHAIEKELKSRNTLFEQSNHSINIDSEVDKSGIF